MLVLRVRCVDDGKELLIERHGADAYSIQVVDLKQIIIQQRQKLYCSTKQYNVDVEGCFVLFRGQILADADIVDLNALNSSDFFVFTPDAPLSNADSSTEDNHSASFDVLLSQLIDMGFSTELSVHALRQCNNNLADAAALLVEDKVQVNWAKDGSNEGSSTIENSSSNPIRRFDKDLMRLKDLVTHDSFETVLLLNKNFSTEALNELNDNPVAALQLLSLPVHTPPAEITKSSKAAFQTDHEDTREVPGNDTNSAAINRLVAMGFARDLVEILYESCNGDEQLTANALLQTLD